MEECDTIRKTKRKSDVATGGETLTIAFDNGTKGYDVWYR